MAEKHSDIDESIESMKSTLELLKAPEKGYVLGFRVAGVPFLFHKYFWAGGVFFGTMCVWFAGGFTAIDKFFIPFLIGIAGMSIIIFTHEMGHFVAAKILHVPMRAVVFFARGGVVVLKEKMQRGFVRRMIVLAAGVFAQLILLIAAEFFLSGTKSMPMVAQSFYVVLVFGNLFIMIISLIPYPGSDGQQMLAVMAHETLLKMGLDENTEIQKKANTDSKDYPCVRISTHNVLLTAQNTKIEKSVEAQASLTFRMSKAEYETGAGYIYAYGDYKSNKNPLDDIYVRCLKWTALAVLPLITFALALYFNMTALAAMLFGVLVLVPLLLLSLRGTLINDKARDFDIDGEQLGNRTIVVTKHSLFVVNNYGCLRYPWGSIRKIVNTPDCILLFTDMFRAYIIPTRVFFDDSQKKRFMNLLEVHDSSTPIT